MTTLRLVRVIWEDASVLDDGPWADRVGLKPAEATIFDQVGWLMEMTNDHVVLSACIGRTLISPRDRIPMGMVKSIHEYAQGDGSRVTLPKKRRNK